jgi:hypothetical protein
VPRREFKNPLTQRSDTLPSTYTETSTETSTSPSTFPYTSTQSTPRRHRGALAFEKTHERVTLWLQKSYKRQFEALAEKEGVSKASLLDEAIRDLLDKYNALNL